MGTQRKDHGMIHHRSTSARDAARAGYIARLPPEQQPILAQGFERLDQLDRERGWCYPPSRARVALVWPGRLIRRLRGRQ